MTSEKALTDRKTVMKVARNIHDPSSMMQDEFVANIEDARKARSTLIALLDRAEAAEAEVERLRVALQDVVAEYPVAAGTAKGIRSDEQGYGSIGRARQTLGIARAALRKGEN